MSLSVYPARVWGIFLLLLMIALIPGFDWISYWGVIIYTTFEVASRHRRINPLGILPNTPYYQWLKTTPYHPSKPLPNGPLLPGYYDMLFLLAIAIAMLPILRESIWFYTLMVSLTWSLVIVLYSLIAARQLVNMGPTWIGFAIIIAIVLALKIYYAIFTTPEISSLKIFSLPLLLLPASLLAVVGMKMIMNRYPWTDELVNPTGHYRGYSLRDIKWGYADVMLAGQPYTSLRPRPNLPRVSWSDAIFISLLPTVIMPLSLSGSSLATYYGLIASGALAARITFYLQAHGLCPATGGTLLSLRQGKLWDNVVFSLLILLLIDIAGIVLVRYLPTDLDGPAAVILMFLTWLAAIKLPPSRATWETSGRWQMSLDVEEPKKIKAPI